MRLLNSGKKSLKDNYLIVLGVTLFISITDFLLYTNKYLFLTLFILIFIHFSLKVKSIDKHIIIYSLLICSLFLINYIIDQSFNSLLFMPILGYLFYTILIKMDINKYLVIDNIIKGIVLISLFFAIIELLVKLNFIDINIIKDFIINYGDQRIDVLRVRIFYGSSLSTATLTVFLSFYFIYFKKNSFFLFLTFIIILLSGSRTAFGIFVMLFIFNTFINKDFFIYTLSIKKSRLIVTCLICIISVAGIIYSWDSVMFKILHRATNITLDESFYGRGSTSVETLVNLIYELPMSLFYGLNNSYISDSAFTSIAATSGLFAAVLILFYLIYLLIKTKLSNIKKLFFIFIILIGMSMIGDFIVPSVLFLYIITFLIYANKEQYEKN